MNKQIALSIEQMKKLQELGVDMSNASMFYVPKIAPKNEYCLLNVKPNPIIPYIPAFTLQDIIELLPPFIITSDNSFVLRIGKDEIGILYIGYVSDRHGAVSFDGKPVDSAYQMLCWCAENGYLKGGKK